MRLQEFHHEIIDILGLYGITPVIENTGGGHLRFRWAVEGKRQSIITAQTPSDWRAGKNEVARVRRKLRNAGIHKIAPLPTLMHKPAAPPKPTIEQLEARIAQLERDVEMLMDKRTTPEPKVEPPKPKKRAAVNKGQSWLWSILRYDEFIKVPEIAKRAGKTYKATSSALSFYRKQGLVERKSREGWRKHRKLEAVV